MKIGFQGDIGSNFEEAAKNFIKKLNIKDYKLIPLISSKNVLEDLEVKDFVTRVKEKQIFSTKNKKEYEISSNLNI